jgi:hypothetical protein
MASLYTALSSTPGKNGFISNLTYGAERTKIICNNKIFYVSIVVTIQVVVFRNTHHVESELVTTILQDEVRVFWDMTCHWSRRNTGYHSPSDTVAQPRRLSPELYHRGHLRFQVILLLLSSEKMTDNRLLPHIRNINTYTVLYTRRSYTIL